jgi:hypothetical protein
MRALGLFLLATGCSAYDPNLGSTPFLCGTEDPRCPDGYACQSDGSGRMVCVQGGNGVDGSMPGMCANDSALEPNDTYMTAFPTPVEGTMMHVAYSGLAICPGTDKDTYRIDINTQGHNIDVVLTYDPGPPLSVSILGVSGAVLVNGSPSGTNQVTAHLANSDSGGHFAQVFSPNNQQNNYKIDITTSP